MCCAPFSANLRSRLSFSCRWRCCCRRCAFSKLGELLFRVANAFWHIHTRPHNNGTRALVWSINATAVAFLLLHLENIPMACFLSSALTRNTPPLETDRVKIDAPSPVANKWSPSKSPTPNTSEEKARDRLWQHNCNAIASKSHSMAWYRRFSCASTETLSSNAKKLEVTKHPCLIRKRWNCYLICVMRSRLKFL